MFWTPRETALLIEAVRQRDALYNPSSMHYKHRFAMQNCWKEVSEAVGTKSVAECREKWHILRAVYRRQPRLGQKRKFTKFPWYWSEEMSFLDKCTKLPHRGKPRVPPAPAEDAPSSPPPPSPLVHKEQEVLLPAPLVSYGDADGTEEEQESRRAPKVKMRRSSEGLEAEIREYLKMKRSNEEVDPFFVSMSRDMLRLSDRDKSRFKIRVQETLHAFLYGEGVNS